ncbi:MAG: hypothetical protein NPIRA02_13240 [Nitrospirales bacterium]|nr:MAG: hypothetical protein NPIRA02_13240 [Nitrospirales bacterium]
MNSVGVERDIRLLAITYEPQFDTPRRIKRFVTSRGLVTNSTTMAIRLKPKQHAAFIEDLKPPVAYNADWVTAHGIELNLLDSKGRFVRKYGTILWDNGDVVQDFKRLLDEG